MDSSSTSRGKKELQAEGPKHEDHHGRMSSGGDTHKRAMKQSGAGSDRSFDRSPAHPRHNQAKCGGGSRGITPLTPGRSRLGSATRSDETPDPSATVPKFGDWDESNPASGDGFTGVFNRVREERQGGGAGTVPVLPTEASHSNGRNKQYNENSKSRCCCFPW